MAMTHGRRAACEDFEGSGIGFETGTKEPVVSEEYPRHLHLTLLYIICGVS
jgi:hypothetical protein